MTDVAMSPLDRLTMFERAREAIDRLYLSRAIDAGTRRDRLIAARDAAGITAMRTNARTTATAAAVEAEDEKRRLRRLKGDRNRHARKKAGGSAAHG